MKNNPIIFIILACVFPATLKAVPIGLLDIDAYSDIMSTDLSDLSRSELILLRSSIYARHGFVFQQGWIQRHFQSMPWYSRNPGFSYRQLTEKDFKEANFLQAEIDRRIPILPKGLEYRFFHRLQGKEALAREWIKAWDTAHRLHPDVISRPPTFLNFELFEPLSFNCKPDQIESDSCGELLDAAYNPAKGHRLWPIVIAGYSAGRLRTLRTPSYGPSQYPGDTYLFDNAGKVVAVFQDALGTTRSTTVIVDYFADQLVRIEYITYLTGQFVGKEAVVITDNTLATSPN